MKKLQSFLYLFANPIDIMRTFRNPDDFIRSPYTSRFEALSNTK